ncbi:Urb2/Npa2 family-domain-containing protein [Radiomyces spectabilis]|uniref:Urb2/Npa2 family-domain-containing protein n=1 Tax=Radiomyces spectabilis TaxID=64574 RepID=UPI002221153E|nr:Urb2/Npa2 family-domain-containing protein [Radiomyces spectabilis]KAI8368318.1 Urb2/Npa2 family-domain-containing protein [Radiomyces spectabilis]
MSSRFIDSSRAEKLATVLFLSTSESPSSVINGVNTVSLQSLSKTLLRSANFYEARCFKECAVSIIVQAIADHFRTLSSKETHSTVLISFISHISSSKPVVLSSDIMAEIESVMDETFTQMNEDIKQEETTKLDKVATLINLLLLMPMDYYSRQERQNILVLVCLVDVWTFSLGGADLNCKLKTSSICRALNARITQFTHTLGFLNQRPKFVNWFVRSYDCLQRSLNQELDSELLHSWKSVSKNLDQQNLSILCTMASAKVKDENHIVLFKDTLNQRMQSLRDSKVVFEMINFDSILNALEVLNNNLKTIDLTHAIYASDFMSYIAGYVNESLQEFTSVIVMLAQKVTESGEGAQNEDVMRCALNVALFRPVLEATRWLQEYAQILIPHGDQVVQAKELSDSLIAVASPFMQFLQAYLARISDDVLFTNALAESTIAFVGALCVTLSRYQEIDATKRILATIWFVYGLIAESGNRVAVQALDDTFTSWFESLPKHQFEVLVQSFLEQIEEETERRLDVEREGHRKICISLLVSLIKKSTSSQKFQLRKLTSRIGLSLMKLAETTTSLDLFCRIMDLLNCMASDPSLEFSRYDLSLVLACLVQIGSESALDRFRSQMTRTIAHELFNKVCSSLMSLAVFHRDQLINNMTPYMALLQSLLHCFKSTHMALVSNKSKKKSGDTQESMRHARVIPLLFEYAPLDESSAHIYSRTLKTIPRKSDKTTKSNTQTIYRSLSKHMPYLLLEYFTIQTNVTMSISRPEIKAALVSGLYDIMDMCNENDRTLIMTCLNAPGKTLFKTFYTNWKEDHKYTGQ